MPLPDKRFDSFLSLYHDDSVRCCVRRKADTVMPSTLTAILATGGFSVITVFCLKVLFA